jgi:hypothetical protein
MSKKKKNQARPRFFCRACGLMWVSCEPMCVICKVHGEPLNEGAEKVLRKAKNGGYITETRKIL